jgi:hypothetical protein
MDVHPTTRIGNLIQLNDPDGLEFHYRIGRDYGGAAKVHGLLGVCRLHSQDIFFVDNDIY